LQGWALDGATEVFGVKELVARFDIKDVQKAGAIFDLDKFRWMAGEYLRRMTPEELADACAPFVVAAQLTSAEDLAARRAWFVEVVKSEQARIHIYSELPPRIAYLFQPDDAVVWTDEPLAAVRKHANAAQTLVDFRAWLAPRIERGVDAAELRESAKKWAQEKGLKLPAFFQPVRLALSGVVQGADLFDVMALLGPERVLARLERGAARLSN
jgi:glutamyl/glutaminyl-tRNA synthetase